MKALYKYTALLGFVLLFITKSYSQSLPITSYGVWDRGGGIPDYSSPNADFVRGIETTLDWKDIQAGPGTNNCDFSAFQTILDVAVANDKLIRFSVNVGPDCPLWVFDNGVPLVNVISNAPKNDAYANRNPYYPDPEYKAYYFEMIRQFALFLRNQPQVKFDHIAFVQVKTGCTGDEEPYKGDVINPIYDLSTAQWEAFRLEAFAKFKENFNDVTTRKIVLTFNNVDPVSEPLAYNYVMTQLDPVLGFGIKGGAFNRGHHLSDEQTYKEQWNPFLINPKVGPGNPNGVKLFSASEMDQSWDKGYFALNYEIGFYWSSLGGINTGLSCTNISVSAMTYALANPGIIDIFKMYNRYAQQVYPLTATTAFSVFHEGLNSADTVKFPESIYGNATKTNLTRYQNICNDPKYANRGARIDDPIAVVKAQVFQREDQEFYNDAGWDICEGNIERFMTQINPDDTSIGLFRVRGPITSTSSKYDRFARSFENSTGKNTMYFQLHNEFPASNKILKFTIIWLDKTVGSTWAFKYRNAAGLQTIPYTGSGTNQWKTETITISDAIMNQGGTLQSDFMLVNTDAIDDIFNGIEMNILGIIKQNQTINFNVLPLKTAGDSDFSPLATASSGLAVSYTSSNTAVATIVNGNIRIVGGGSSIITASQVGDDYYNPAISVSQNLSVSAVNQATITTSGTWTCPAGVTSIKVEAWGGGGGGGGTLLAGFAGGGAGGSYVINDSVTVVPATSYSVTVGSGGALTGNGGANGNNGGNTTFGSTTPITANGGVAGSGTTVAGQLGSRGTNSSGGSGGTVTLGLPGASGASGSGGAGGAGAFGGAGAASRTTVGNGFSVTTLGGGGGGAYGSVSGSNKGGAGGAGQIKITYTVGLSNAPIIGTATVSGVSGQASISYTAPAFNGNSTIITYTATSSPGGITATVSQAGSGTILVNGLTNGTAYTFTITATNGVGQSTASAASNAVTPYTFPSAPTIGSAAASGVSGQATVSFTAPASNGGSSITSYTAISSPGGITGTLSQAGSGTILVNGLTNGTAYTFTVRATNAGGLSAVSGTSNTVTPISRVPQTITFGSLSAVNYGDAVLPGATASSGLPVTYTSDNPLVATTSGSTITVVGAGSVTISAVQAGDGTYAAATPVIQTLVVNKKTLSITTPSIASKVYNSLPDSGVVTPGTLSGLLGTETVTATATGLYPDGNVGTDKLATITYLLADGTNGGKAANYSLAIGSAAGAITQAPLTVVGIVANNKPEDGNATASLSAFGSLSGVFASDTANVTLVSSSVSANFDSAAVGMAKPVTISGYTITGSASANYSFAQPTGITANITVPNTFYFVSAGTDFNVTSNWWSVSNGTGLNPSNLTTANITYTIYSNATTTAPLTLGSGSKIVVGNASVAPVILTVNNGFPITGTINIDAALSESNSVVWKDITTPSFGTLDNTSEVHLQAVTNYSTSATFGKLFIDPASGFTIMSGTPTIKTSLTVPFGSGLSFSNANQPYILINSGASVSIDGYLKTGKVGGAFAYNVTTPVNTLGSLQFVASTPNFTLGSASTIEYSRTTVSSTQTISALPIGVNYANLTITDSGSICNKSFPSSVTVNGTFTLNQSASTLTGCAFLNLANGATIVRTAGALNVAPTFGTSVNVTYNGITSQTPSFEMPTNGSVLNNLMINNPAGVTLGASTTVNGTLALTAGVLTTGLNILTVAASGSTSRTTGWVNGNLRKFILAGAASATFEIGDLTVNYTPVTTAFTGAITGATGSIIAKTAASDTTTSGSGIVSTKSVNRTWILTNDNAVPGLTSYDASFTYASTDNDAGATPANYAVKLYATAWSTIPTSGTTTDTAATATGITGFGEFAIGETPVVPPVATITASGTITFCSGGSVTLSANTGAGLTYLWSPGGATTSSVTVTASGSYTVTVTGTGGSTTSMATMVTVNPLTTNGSVTTSICAGDSYTWPLPNGTGITYTTAQTGLTNVVGCNTATLNLTITPKPAQPILACYESATFNTNTCSWDVTGTQLAAPTDLACYESATFNTNTCSWVVTGTQQAQPTLACYETANFNTTTCQWDVTGTQDPRPTTACYETASFNTTSCSWDVTGTQPAQPTLACYESATFNTTTCAWDVTRTQASPIVTTTISCNSYFWLVNSLTYTQSGTYNVNVNCQDYTLNLTINNVTYNDTTNTSCGSYFWENTGQTYVTSGTYIGTTTNCITERLILTISSPVTINTNLPATANICTTVATTSKVTLTASITTTATVSYQWELSTDSGVNWSNISATANAPYSSGTAGASLTITRTTTLPATGTQYRLRIFGGCNGTQITTPTTLTVDPTLTASRAITPATSTVCATSNYTLLTLATGTGSVQWQSSTSSLTGPFSDISNANGSTYSANGLTTTTWFRVTYSNACGSRSTATVVINVNQAAVAGAVTPAVSNVCSGTNTTKLTSAAYTGTAIAWERSLDGSTTWTSFTGTALTLTVTNLNAATLLTNTVLYRTKITSGVCTALAYSDPVTINISNPVVTKLITPATSAVCIGTNSTLLSLGAGYVGSIQWQSVVSATQPAATSTSWTNITNASTATYTAAGLTTTTWFRVVLTNGVCVANTTPVMINVSTAVVGGNAYIGTTGTTSATVCAAITTPTVVTNNTQLTLAGHTGNIVWEKALVSAPNTWSAAGAANTSTTFTATGLTTSTIYRAKVSNGACVAFSNPITITVSPIAVAGQIIAPVTVCSGSSPIISLSGSNGTNITWESTPSPATTSSEWVELGIGTSYTATNLTSATVFRAVVYSGVCPSSATTAVETVKVDLTPSGGIVSGGGLLCTLGAATVSVTGTVGTYKWQYSEDNITWTDVPFGIGTGAQTAIGGYFKSNSATRTAATYSFTAFNLLEASSIAFRVLAVNGTCTTAVGSVNPTVFTSGTPNGGTIALSVPSTTALPICSAVSPALNAPVLVVTGTTGTLQWQKVTSATAPTSSTVWTDITFTSVSGLPPATGTTLTSAQIGTLAANTWFRLRARLGTGTTCLAFSQPFAITVAPKAIAGTLSATGGNTLCNPGGVSGIKIFTVSSAAVGNRFTLQSSPTLTFVAGSITNVDVITTGSSYTTNSVVFTVNNIAATTYYRVFVESTNGAGVQCSNAITATLTLAVSNPIAGTIAPTVADTGTLANPICNGANMSLTLSNYVFGNTTNTGTISWQSSLDGLTGWTTQTGATATLLIANLAQTTYYRARITPSTGCFDETLVYTVFVKPTLGTISLGSSASQQLCSSNTGSTLIATIPSGLTFTRWERATVTPSATGGQTIGTTWTAITNTTTTLSTGALTASTAYRAKVVPDGTCTANTPTFIVTVLRGGTVSGGTTGTQTLCPSTSRTLTLTLFQGSSYQWQSATVTAGATQPAATSIAWANISGATSTSYAATGGAAGTTTWYRVLVNYATGACATGVASTTNTSITWSNALGCLTLRPAEVPEVFVSRFEVKAYPNPYTETFNLSLTTSSEDKVSVVVYDMTGRLIERKDFRPSEKVEQQIGERYPSGVYKVVVNQGEEVKTLRVIKK